ncbi:MAG: hotdog fold thioesterase [Bacteroidetes bacterium]|nr:hotdog fold thioesterase [Bacteroidota bacterium]
MPSPSEITNAMMQHDYFSQWLGIEVVSSGEGSAVLKMKIRHEMLNGFGIAHGGITYSLADSALAFASNSHGQKSVSVETSISHTQSLREGDEIVAIAREEHRSNKIAVYSVQVLCHDKVVALFKGTVYRTSGHWE